MKKYAILANSSHNRVYFESSKKLALCELTIALSKMSVECVEPCSFEIANIFYLGFSSQDTLSESDLNILSKLSFCYAIFEIREIEDNQLLLPVAKSNFEYINSSISSILKYQGKTNEVFTRMLLNIAILSTEFYNDADINLLDPIAGKGTTLYEGLVAGYNCYGIEVAVKPSAESFHFMKKFLEIEKYRHNTKIERQSGPNKSFTAIRHQIELGHSKADFKNRTTKYFEMITGNGAHADKFFRKNFFNIIVGDLPYGVQHGNVSNEKQPGMTRSPKELLYNCLKQWNAVLKTGGAIALSWNSFVLSRSEFIEVLEKFGFTPLNEGVYLEFEHRVDQAIKRDVIVAIKTSVPTFNKAKIEEVVAVEDVTAIEEIVADSNTIDDTAIAE